LTRRSRIAARVGALILFAALAAVASQALSLEERSLIINEVEVNPEGVDHGNEWLEILNVSERSVDLAGWSLSYTYRGPGTVPLVDVTTILGPGERFVFVYSRISLRNGSGNVIRLIDPVGWIADETSPLLDEDDDDRTWQRFPDGGDAWFPDLWVFNAATRGRTND